MRFAGDVALTALMGSGGAVLADQLAHDEMDRMAQGARDFNMRELLLHPPGSDPRDYQAEPGLWRSELLPLGVSIDQAIKDGVW